MCIRDSNRGVKIISCPSCARQQFDVIETVKKIENKVRVTKNIICFKSIFDSDSKNHSLINRNPTAMRMVKIRKIFCKYRMTKIHPTKSNAAGNL